jgi:hypothetical protein
MSFVAINDVASMHNREEILEIAKPMFRHKLDRN